MSTPEGCDKVAIRLRFSGMLGDGEPCAHAGEREHVRARGWGLEHMFYSGRGADFRCSRASETSWSPVFEPV